MQSIKTRADMLPFAGKLIAFTSDSYNFSDNRQGEVIFANVSRWANHWDMCGEEDDNQAFNLTRYKVPGDVSSNCACLDHLLVDANLQVRLADKSEIPAGYRLEYGATG